MGSEEYERGLADGARAERELLVRWFERLADWAWGESDRPIDPRRVEMFADAASWIEKGEQSIPLGMAIEYTTAKATKKPRTYPTLEEYRQSQARAPKQQ